MAPLGDKYCLMAFVLALGLVKPLIKRTMLPSALIFFWWSAAVPLLAEGQKQRIVEAPVDSSVRLGANAVLNCRVENQKGVVLWIKNGLGLGADRNLPAFPRYTMIGSSAEGEWNLRIENVQLDDDDIYQCQVSPSATDPGQLSAKAKLNVLVPPSSPTLVNVGRSFEAVVGRSASVTCKSQGGKPAAKLVWAITGNRNGSNIIRRLGEWTANNGDSNSEDSDGEIDVSESVVERDGLYDVRSDLTFQPRLEDDGRYLTCLARHATYEPPRMVLAAETELELQYAPLVTVTLNSSGSLKEGGSARLSCAVDAKPVDDVQIVWRKDGVMVRSQMSDTYLLADLRREHDGSVFECVARNSVGVGNSSITLQVKYGPRILSPEQQLGVDIGESATFSCVAVGNPAPRVQWTRSDRSSRVLSTAQNFTLHNIDHSQQGEYLCTAAVPGFAPVTARNYLNIKGPPVVYMSKQVRTSLGSTAEIRCSIRGYPPPSEVIWLRGGVPLDLTLLADRYSVIQRPRPQFVESILSIKGVRQIDYSVFNCTAVNGLGIDSGETHLIPLDPIPMYLVIPGIIVICVLVLLFILIILLRRQNMCGSKSSRYSDEHSDVGVKCEAIDGQFYPDMYGPPPLENGDMVYTKDYVSVPQDNPDFDMLPPPQYGMYRASNGYASSSQDGNHNGHVMNNNNNINGSNGRLPSPTNAVMVTGNGHYQSYQHPNGSHSQLIVSRSPDYGQSPYDAYRPEPVGYASFTPVGSLSSELYYPSEGLAPLAPLETLQEVPTPETEAATPLLSGHRGSSNSGQAISPRVHQRCSSNDRPTSRSSTHV